MHNLPLYPFTDGILKYLDKASPNYSEELAAEIKYNGLSSIIWYDNAREKIMGAAAITGESQIVIYENYIAFVWCLSFAVISLLNNRRLQLDPITDENLHAAILLLDYGYSLTEDWTEWPTNLPDPTRMENRYVDEANAITTLAMSYIIAHEIGHHVLGHDLSGSEIGENAKKEEFSSDKYAFDVLIGGHEQGYDSKNHSINTAIIIGLGSILLLENSWSGGDTHPDSDERLQKILQNIQDVNDSGDEYWKIGLVILFLWNIQYRKTDERPTTEKKSAKEDYLKFAEYLKERQ